MRKSGRHFSGPWRLGVSTGLAVVLALAVVVPARAGDVKMDAHAMATLALAELWGMAGGEEIRASLERADPSR